MTFCRNGRNPCGGSSSISAAFVHPRACDFLTVEANYEACISNVFIHYHHTQSPPGKRTRSRQHVQEGYCMESFGDAYWMVDHFKHCYLGLTGWNTAFITFMQMMLSNFECLKMNQELQSSDVKSWLHRFSRVLCFPVFDSSFSFRTFTLIYFSTTALNVSCFIASFATTVTFSVSWRYQTSWFKLNVLYILHCNTNQLPGVRVLTKLIVEQPIKKFPAFYGIQSSSTVFITGCHLTHLEPFESCPPTYIVFLKHSS